MKTTQNRKLSAILFADIVGYTALMQSDEATANQLLDKFHSTLGDSVTAHGGEVINNYGDGCVCTFDSAVSAMKCAKEVQLLFQQDPKVPVRIGVHSGDVLFKDNNVYGDSVNLASRIESLGVPGAILFSASVEKHIANQTEFDVQSLGAFHFKNVEKPMEVFAIANEGLVVPKKDQMKGKLRQAPKASTLSKKLIWGVLAIALISIGAWWLWQGQQIGSQSINNITNKEILPSEIRDRNVAVMIFEDETNDESLNAIGKMISDWISSGLMEINKGKVISATHVRDNIAYASVGGGAQPSFAEQTGAEVLVQGRYYKVENNVFIKGNIINALDGTIIKSMKVVSGNKGDIMSLIDDFTQQILGFWATSKSDRYKKRPPKFEAYQAYLIARENWTANDALAEQKLKESYSLDSTYMETTFKNTGTI